MAVRHISIAGTLLILMTAAGYRQSGASVYEGLPPAIDTKKLEAIRQRQISHYLRAGLDAKEAQEIAETALENWAKRNVPKYTLQPNGQMLIEEWGKPPRLTPIPGARP